MLERKIMEEKNEFVEVRDILESIPFGCILIKRNGKILRINRFAINMLKKAERHFDKKIDDLEGEPIVLLHKSFEKWGRNFNEIMFGNKKIMIDAGREKIIFSIRRADFCKKIDSFLVVVESFEKDTRVDNEHNFSMKKFMECMEIFQKNSGEVAKKLDDITVMVMEIKNVASSWECSSGSNGELGKRISSMAQQFSLLALNATIEAARLGESGKSFGVVAQEIKNMSGQIDKLAENITEKDDLFHENRKKIIELTEKIVLSAIVTRKE